MSSLSDEEINKAIGRRVQQVRKKAGLTQADLATLLSRSVGAISHMEKGRTAISAAQLFRIAVRCGRQPAEMYVLPLDEVDVPQLLVAIGTHLRPA